jgi:hypothetical protein
MAVVADGISARPDCPQFASGFRRRDVLAPTAADEREHGGEALGTAANDVGRADPKTPGLKF